MLPRFVWQGPVGKEKMAHLAHWIRLATDSGPVYVDHEKPDWFVPSQEADEILQLLAASRDTDEAAVRLAASRSLPLGRALLTTERLRAQVSAEPAPAYMGRASHLRLTGLKECWFHLTNRCNLACGHCLFGASENSQETLPFDLLRQGLRQARQLGCTLFCFTGGEPFLYPDFLGVLADLLADPTVHAVVLTNGLLLDAHLEALQALPQGRLHLQVSLDGLEQNHEQLRGSGSFGRLMANLDTLRTAGLAVTLSVAINRANLVDLPALVDLAAAKGIHNLHLLWHFLRGKGTAAQFVSPAEILPVLIAAQERAERIKVTIDNVEAMKGQVFSTPGTRHDLSGTAWESLAVGPDGAIFPSPALVAIPELRCGHLSDGLEQVWRTSPVLETIRQATLADCPELAEQPLKFITGGGDLDHSFLAGGDFVGHDPYLELYNGLALWLITRQAACYPDRPGAHLRLRMGDVRHDCPEAGGREVALTHCNCMVSLADDLGHASVREFYARAARVADPGIQNPFAPAQAAAAYIPAESKTRSYGCGSPIQDAAPGPGETVVDLGSGSGVECFMAAKAVGAAGRVIGIDMTDAMLDLARASKAEVVAGLGYDNVMFQKGFLEDLPLEADTVDAVISNCVINLSPDKRRTFHEIYRILTPGGRLVVSDIVTDLAIPVTMKNDARFRGECLGGALQQEALVAMLRAAGFVGIYLLKRFPYRQEGGVDFFALTFRCYKAREGESRRVVYRGPLAAVSTDHGELLLKGRPARLAPTEAAGLDETMLVLDEAGAVTNLPMASSCCGGEPGPISPTPVIIPLRLQSVPGPGPLPRHHAGCMACGQEITYLKEARPASCYYCGRTQPTNAMCARGHFICDDCHQHDGLAVIQLICAETREQDMLRLLATIRRHPAIPMHGPEHHAMMPGIILATYRNRGGAISRETILAGIARGSKVPGGVCGFWGACGAATGVGIAFATLLEATPLTPAPRRLAQMATAQVLAAIAATEGGRCCQRETVTALQEAARLSQDLLPIALLAAYPLRCTQFKANQECIKQSCHLWPTTGDVCAHA